MNIVDALNTTLDLRRPIVKHTGVNGDQWLNNAQVRSHVSGKPAQNPLPIDINDVLATDWSTHVVPDPIVNLTRTLFLSETQSLELSTDQSNAILQALGL